MALTAAATPAQAHAASVAVSIKTGSRIHDFTRPVKISGRVSSHRPGVRLTLYASEFPFQAARVVAGQTSTRRAGNYRFKVKSALATRYVVALSKSPTVESRTLTDYVDAHISKPKCNLCGHLQHNGAGAHVLRFSFEARIPSVVASESSKPWFFYYGQRNGSQRAPTRLRLVKTLTPAPLGADLFGVSSSLRIFLPFSAWGYRYITCSKDTEAVDGFGLPGSHQCGDPTITLRPKTYLG